MNLTEGLRLKLFDQRQSGGLILLMIAGFLGNYFRWTLFFDIDFLLGSIAVWLVVCLYGVRWGTLAGLIAGYCTYIIWHHPYTVITFTLEALFVGWRFHKRQQSNLVLLDALFWLVLGMPLVWLFYAIVLHLDPAAALIILFKQPVNGIFNALIASLMLTHLPIHRWVNRPLALSTLSLEQTLFNSLVTFVLVPTLILIVLASQQVVPDIKSTARLDLNNASRYLTVEVNAWYERRLAVVNGLADLAMSTSIQSDALKQGAAFVSRTFPEFRHIHVFDQTGKQLLDIDRADVASPIAFDEINHFEQLRRSPQPMLFPVQQIPGKAGVPIALLGVPLIQDGKLVGAIFSEIDLGDITALLKANVTEQDLRITLLDQQQTVVASTQTKWIGAQAFNWRQNGRVEPIDTQTYHWLPTTDSPLVLAQWQNSLFVKESTLNPSMPWTLIIQLSATPQAREIEHIHTRNMAILLVVSGLALIFATLISRRLVKPLTQLAQVTTNLPHKLLEQEPIPWMHSQVSEIALLVRNFRSMAASLQQKFGEIHYTNALLVEAQHVARLGSWELNVLTGEVTWSAELFQFFGFDPTQPAPTYEQQRQHFAPDDWLRLTQLVDRAIQFGESYATDLQIIRADGSSGHVFVKGQPTTRNPAGQVTYLVGIVMDISDRKQVEQKLQQTAAQLAASNRELEAFSYSVSHDLRAPIRHLSGFVNLLKQWLESHDALDDPKVTHYLQVIENSSQKMALLIDGLLSLSRLSRKPIAHEPVSLRELVEEAIALLQNQPETPSPAKFVIGELPIIQGDATLLQQVLSNLIGNAVKFSRHQPSPQIEIGCLPDGTLFVKDNGVGFQMEYADKVFGAFQRLHAQSEFEGTGIGLAIVQRIIHRHGGTIWAESQPNQGAVFYFTVGNSP